MARPLAPCGTYGAYQRHLKRKEPVDPECRQAASDYRESSKVKAQPPPEDGRPVPTVACPVCGVLGRVEYPYDDVAERMARIRHLADSEPCTRAIVLSERRARIPS